MTKEERLAKSRAKILWCVHILGPDELIPKESYALATSGTEHKGE